MCYSLRASLFQGSFSAFGSLENVCADVSFSRIGLESLLVENMRFSDLMNDLLTVDICHINPVTTKPRHNEESFYLSHRVLYFKGFQKKDIRGFTCVRACRNG